MQRVKNKTTITLLVLLLFFGFLAGPGKALDLVEVDNFADLVNKLKTDFLQKFVERFKNDIMNEYQDWLLKDVKQAPGFLLRDTQSVVSLFQPVSEDGTPFRDLIVGSLMGNFYEQFTGLNSSIWSSAGFREAACLSREVLGVDPEKELDRLAAERMLRNVSVILGGLGGGESLRSLQRIQDILNCFSFSYHMGTHMVSNTIDAGASQEEYEQSLRKQAEYSNTVLLAGKDMIPPAGIEKALAKTRKEGIIIGEDDRKMSLEFYQLATRVQKIDYASLIAAQTNSVALQGSAEVRKIANQLQRMASDISARDAVLEEYSSDEAIKDLLKVSLLRARIELLILDQLQAMNRLLAAHTSYFVDYEARERLMKEVIYDLYKPISGGKESPGHPLPPETEFEKEFLLREQPNQ